jgi:hypothetical protein
MGKSKMELIESILEKLKPNSYMDKSALWVDLQSGLLRMNNQELNACYALVVCSNIKPLQK